MHFTDNLKTISSEPLVVIASLHLLSTERGGRKTPFTGKFRPNHNFGSRQNTEFYIGEIFFEDGDCMFPGEAREVTVRFLNVESLASRLRSGLKWRIQEGMCLIGEATVI